jgi:hypothetical protein
LLLCTIGLMSVCVPTAADQREQKNAEPAATPADKRSYQEILAARTAPDLDRLAERCSPDLRGPDATESFWDLLKLREAPDPKAVPVLEKVLVENLPTTRIHGFAAAQALFSIDTPEAQKILKQHLLAEGSQAGMAVNYTSHWEMREPRRSRFIEQYLLKNLSTSLVVKLEQEEPPDPVEGRLILRLILRNASDEAVHLLDPRDDRRPRLYLRDAKQRYISHDYEMTICPGPSNFIELEPGETYSTTLTIVVSKPDSERPVRDASAKAVVNVRESGERFAIAAPGRFEFVGLIEAQPLNAEQRRHLEVDDDWKWWTGRAVSSPVAVELALPDSPEAPSPKN